ncbi:MAG TPA: ABC-three component system protein [Tepidisphaeraceae bacterium]|jgi:hypothetical protein|nr:ABC-three component system protein [Tepidisphaeraceae bacterium]
MPVLSPKDFTAAPQMAGYLFQCRYALLLLLEREPFDPACRVNIEKFDDVTVERLGGIVRSVQTKHHGGSAALTDGSVDWWKTLRAWCALRDAKRLTDSTILSLVTTATAPAKSAAACLRKDDDRAPELALERLRAALHATTSDDVKSTAAAFKGLKKAQQLSLLQKVFVFDTSPNLKDVRTELKRHLWRVAEGHRLDACLDALEGWWFSRVAEHLEGGATEPITATELTLKVADIRETYRRGAIPDYVANLTPPRVNLANDRRLFVEQLRLIKANEGRQVAAVSDFTRAATQRSELVRKGNIDRLDLQQYDEKLCSEWRRLFSIRQNEVPLGAGDVELEKAGRETLTAVEAQQLSLRGFPEPYLMRGSYHSLANRWAGSTPTLGWHPHYGKRLTKTARGATK